MGNRKGMIWSVLRSAMLRMRGNGKASDVLRRALQEVLVDSSESTSGAVMS